MPFCLPREFLPMTARSRDIALVADIGGTNARFALADTGNERPLREDSIRRYAVSDFATLTEAAGHYLDTIDIRPCHAVLAVAGHIRDGEVHATNNPWHITTATVRDALTLESVRLINDFAAQSLCLPLLGPGDAHAIGPRPAPDPGAAARQTFAVIGPGTGLGVGALLLRHGTFSALETEGGHTSFAPADAEEIDILRFLAARHGRVSNERLVSGEGLVNLHQALAAIEGRQAEALAPEQITARAERGTDPLCIRVVERFCAIFGAVSGDAVLHLGGWSGAWLAGGLPPRLLPWLEKGDFRRRFEDKGRLRDALRDTPTAVITHPHAGLLGAAASAVMATGGMLPAQRRWRKLSP